MGVRLFVLGIVYEHDAHGYEIKAAARLWGVEGWAKIGFGSLYHALGALEREGHIRQVGVEQAGSRPPRTVYRVTEAGRMAFLALLRAALVSLDRIDVDLALAFVANLPPEERTTLVEARLVRLRAEIETTRDSLAWTRAELAAVPWVTAALEHGLALREADLAWTTGLREGVAAFPSRDWSEIRLGPEA